MPKMSLFRNRNLNSKDFLAHRGAVLSLDLRPDQTAVLSGGEDGYVRIWHADGGRLLWEHDMRQDVASAPELLPPRPSVSHVEWSPNGKRFLVCFGSQMFVFGAISRVLLRRFAPQRGPVRMARWYGGDSHVMSLCTGDRYVRVWRADRGRMVTDPSPRAFKPEHSQPTCIAVQPCGDRVFVGTGLGGELWSSFTGERYGLSSQPSWCDAAVWALDGQTVFALDGQGALHEYDTRGLAVTPVRRLHETFVTCVARPPRSQVLVSGDDDGVALVWHGGLGPLTSLVGHAGPVRSVAAHRLFDYALTGGEDGTIRKWTDLGVDNEMRKIRQRIGELPPDRKPDNEPGERLVDI